MRLAFLAARAIPRWPAVRRAVLVLGGFGSLSYGAWLLARPAGFIAAGVLLLALDWLAEDDGGVTTSSR